MRNLSIHLVAVVFVLLISDTVIAHKASIFATAQDGVIEGECYFSGGGHPAAVTLDVIDPDGSKLGEAAADSEGRFQFPAQSDIDHTFILDTGDGHRAEFTVTAAELRGQRPAPPGQSSPTPAPDDMDRRIAAAVAEAVQPLRRQLDEYQSRATLHDILGGIGYIVGVAGLLFFLKGRNRPKDS